MPISQINPDGSVKIYSKTTGQVLDVKPEELPKYNPALVADYQKMQVQKSAVDNAVKAAQSGNSKAFDSLPAELKTQAIASGVQIAAPKSAQEIKKEQAANKVGSLIKTLESRYQKAGGGEVTTPILNRIVGMMKDAGGALGFDAETNTFNREREGFIATLKGLTGDTGVMTEQDAQRLINLIPGMGASPQEAKNLFTDLRSQAASELGGDGGKTTINPKEKDALDVLLPQAKSIAQDVGTGIRGKMEQGNLDKNSQMAETLEYEASKEKNLQKKKDMLAQANQLRTATSQEAGNIGQSFSENVNQNPLLRGVEGAGEIATNAQGVDIAAGLPGAIKAIPGKLFPSGAAKATRQGVISSAEASGKTIDGEKIANEFTNWADHAYKTNSGKEKQVDKVIESVINQYSGKKISPQEAMKIWLEHSDGYKADGTVKTALEGKVDVKMREILRPMLEEVAPGFDEATKAIAKGIKNEKVAKWAGGIIGSTLLGGATIYGANRLAGGGR